MYTYMKIDIFNPPVSKVAHGLEGKSIVLVGSNNLGKTKQATRMKKPFHLGFESGLNAIDGVPFALFSSWSEFKAVNKQLTNPKTLEQVKEMYNTIIFDEVYASSIMCQAFICAKYGVETMTDKPEGTNANLYQAYEREYFREIDKLLKAGFTIVFIGHPEWNKELEQWRPKGDKRSMEVIINNADVVCFLKSNGVDEEGRVIKSSAYLAETPEYFARSRFDYIDTYIEEFTAENLEKAIIEAIKRQAEVEGIKTVSFTQQQKERTVDKNYDELLAEFKKLGSVIASAGHTSKVSEVLEEHLWEGATSKHITEKHLEPLFLIVNDLQIIVKDLDIED